MKVNFEILQMQPTFTNSVLVILARSGSPLAEGCPQGGVSLKDCVIFDAWGTADDWDEILSRSGLKLRAIFSTHGHYDHISAAPELAVRHNVPWYLNHNDLFLIPWSNSYLIQMGMPLIPDDYPTPLDLKAGDIEILPGLHSTIIEMPGHSAGGVAFYFAAQKTLIIGDTLFQETVGRYDLPGSDSRALLKSIGVIYDLNLPDDTTVIHGHGENTTIGFLKKNNRYFKKG